MNKLKLDRETLTTLTAQDAKCVEGGAVEETYRCPSNYRMCHSNGPCPTRLCK